MVHFIRFSKFFRVIFNEDQHATLAIDRSATALASQKIQQG
jgi:hypothetical protein